MWPVAESDDSHTGVPDAPSSSNEPFSHSPTGSFCSLIRVVRENLFAILECADDSLSLLGLHPEVILKKTDQGGEKSPALGPDSPVHRSGLSLSNRGPFFPS